MFEQFISQSDFTSYEDFRQNFRILVPENFNFAFNVVDAYAQSEPEKIALVWCDEEGDEATFTFRDMKVASDKIANYLRGRGIGKGDRVMLILKRRHEYWPCIIALHKLGAVAIPGTHLLKAKDLVYRNNAAGIKAIIVVHDERVLQEIELSRQDSPTLEFVTIADGTHEGCDALHAQDSESFRGFRTPHRR